MCRFLLITSKKPLQPAVFLQSFAQMAQNSHALDGDWQGDGWGLCYRINTDWNRYTSLSPVWTDTKIFSSFPAAQLFLAHARSASFPKDKGQIEYNQPYTQGKYAFVFNGLLKGVAFPTPLPGQIGAQKIWSLFLQQQKTSPISALERTVSLLRQHTKRIQALNIGISDGTRISVYSQYAAHPEYYGLHVANTPEYSAVCSEPLPDIPFTPLPPEKIYTF